MVARHSREPVVLFSIPGNVDVGMANVTKRKVRNLFIFLGLGLLWLMVVFEGLAQYLSYTLSLIPLLLVLLGFVAGGLLFIAKF